MSAIMLTTLRAALGARRAVKAVAVRPARSVRFASAGAPAVAADAPAQRCQKLATAEEHAIAVSPASHLTANPRDAARASSGFAVLATIARFPRATNVSAASPNQRDTHLPTAQCRMEWVGRTATAHACASDFVALQATGSRRQLGVNEHAPPRCWRYRCGIRRSAHP